MKVSQKIEGSDVTVRFSYEEGRLVVTLDSKSRGVTTFTLDEYHTDMLKAMLFCLDTTLQKAKEHQARKSLNRSLWDQARKLAGVHQFRIKEIYARLKAEHKEMNQESTCVGAREPR